MILLLRKKQGNQKRTQDEKAEQASKVKRGRSQAVRKEGTKTTKKNTTSKRRK